jgi:hypothetical protein
MSRHKLKTLLRMSGRDRLLLCVTGLLLISIRLGLWLLPFQTLLDRLQRVKQHLSFPRYSVSSIVWAVNVISRYLAPGSKCLARALTTQKLLEWQGHGGELRIGVAKSAAGKLEAHAWVEIENCVVMGHISDLNRYQPLPQLLGRTVP